MVGQANRYSPTTRDEEAGAAPGASAADQLAADVREKALRTVVNMVPGEALAHFKLGEFFAERGRLDEAVPAFQQALELEADLSPALRAMAALLITRREVAAAVELLQRAVTAHPDDPQALCDLGNALVKQKRGREAVAYLERALQLMPGEHRLYSNLGLAFTEAGMFEEAEAAFNQSLRLMPMFASALINLGTLNINMGRNEQARECFDAAQKIEPSNLNAVCNRAIAFLSMGDFERGWRDYQLRWDRAESPHRVYDVPRWQGEPLEGKRILLHTEEGLGDRIQFIRYAEMLAAHGAHVICECPMPLMEVFKSARGVTELVALGSALPAFDCHAPLMSLPFFFSTTQATVPANVPYLAADATRAAAWKERLEKMAGVGNFLIGIAWQGNPHHQWDRFRSMPLMSFEPLMKLPGVRLVSLQRGPGLEQIEAFHALTGDRLLVPTEGGQSTPSDLADSAAIMMNLDLILTVDTATAHLAGALGCPVWTMLSTVTDWRWMTQRQDTPWYPTMRLFRQKRLGDWADVVARVTAAKEIMRTSDRL